MSFNHDIRPIFLKNCTGCHGGVKEAGGVSFIYREKALSKGESGNFTIVPGEPDSSELLRRVRSKDPDMVMPQPKHGSPLSENEIAKLEQWIREGAKWEEHWAFMQPKDRQVDDLQAPDWVSQPLDRFVLEKIESAGLQPSPEASPAEWLRRTSFDLTGLPPSVRELTDFQEASEADAQAARQETVERLLNSPGFGERCATVWLDLARYADTYGFEKDPHRDVWPWRDWVVRAFNADMP